MIVVFIIACDFITCLCFLTQNCFCYVSSIDEINICFNYISFWILFQENYISLEFTI